MRCHNGARLLRARVAAPPPTARSPCTALYLAASVRAFVLLARIAAAFACARASLTPHFSGGSAPCVCLRQHALSRSRARLAFASMHKYGCPRSLSDRLELLRSDKDEREKLERSVRSLARRCVRRAWGEWTQRREPMARRSRTIALRPA